jgi:1-pyrroline-5-carboxylate dehydrogenase
VGDPEDFTNFITAVIDKTAFETITGYIEFARISEEAEIVTGGKYDDTKGWFIEPTTIVTTNPEFKTMTEEIFGPVLTIYIYPDAEYDKILDLCEKTSPYGLTGAIFAQDRESIAHMSDVLCNAAGNFYINDKPTAAVINQQPFGGSRSSGTNDKAGIGLNMMRWLSVRAIKETMVPVKEWRYDFMQED